VTYAERLSVCGEAPGIWGGREGFNLTVTADDEPDVAETGLGLS
jgi:hypothetical protein